jgi:hypothetical protein
MYSDWNLEFVEFVESCGLVHNLWNLVDSPQFVESVESCGLLHNVKNSTIFGQVRFRHDQCRDDVRFLIAGNPLITTVEIYNVE